MARAIFCLARWLAFQLAEPQPEPDVVPANITIVSGRSARKPA